MLHYAFNPIKFILGRDTGVWTLSYFAFSPAFRTWHAYSTALPVADDKGPYAYSPALSLGRHSVEFFYSTDTVVSYYYYY